MTSTASTPAQPDHAGQSPSSNLASGAPAPAPASPVNARPDVVPVPASISANAFGQAAKPKATLADIDKALAANLDVMLQHDGPVEGILQEHPAPPELVQADAIVQQAERAAPPTRMIQAPAAQASHTNSAANPASLAEQTSELETPPLATTEVDQPATCDQPAPIMTLAARADESAHEFDDTPATIVGETTPQHQAGGPAPQAYEPLSAAHSPQPMPVARHEAPVHIPIGVGSPAVIDVSPPPQPLTRRIEMVVRQFASARQPLVAILALLNAPMQKIPAKFRPAMDWLAISLALWVPVVWVVAVMTSHAGDEYNNVASDGSHHTSSERHGASASAAVHESSILKSH